LAPPTGAGDATAVTVTLTVLESDDPRAFDTRTQNVCETSSGGVTYVGDVDPEMAPPV
jgi:hypothetical protein